VSETSKFLAIGGLVELSTLCLVSESGGAYRRGMAAPLSRKRNRYRTAMVVVVQESRSQGVLPIQNSDAT
jgi:hypothetical protein